MFMPMPSWRNWLKHLVRWACSLDAAKAGNSIAARIAMMAMTTKSSMSVNPAGRFSVRGKAVEVISFVIITDEDENVRRTILLQAPSAGPSKRGCGRQYRGTSCTHGFSVKFLKKSNIFFGARGQNWLRCLARVMLLLKDR